MFKVKKELLVLQPWHVCENRIPQGVTTLN